jgi:ribosomal protein S18 acetylase RimI-like enzyme
VRIRRATPDDAPTIAVIHVAASRAAYQHLLPEEFLSSFTVERRERGWRQSLEADECQVWIAEEGADAVGWICTGPCRDPDASPTTAELWAMYLLPTRWRQGIGRALWQAALAPLEAAGATAITLWVLEANHRARAFYRSLGFEEDPGMTQVRTRGGKGIAELRLRHLLGAAG